MGGGAERYREEEEERGPQDLIAVAAALRARRGYQQLTMLQSILPGTPTDRCVLTGPEVRATETLYVCMW